MFFFFKYSLFRELKHIQIPWLRKIFTWNRKANHPVSLGLVSHTNTKYKILESICIIIQHVLFILAFKTHISYISGSSSFCIYTTSLISFPNFLFKVKNLSLFCHFFQIPSQTCWLFFLRVSLLRSCQNFWFWNKI